MKKLFSSLTHRGAALWSPLAVLALLALLAVPASAQTGTVEGRVTSAGNGQPLDGAQVTIVGTSLGTRTDADGRYTINNVPAGAQQVRVAAIGFALGTLQLTIPIGSSVTADLQVNTSVLRLDEVVVTGTAGNARRREIGNSITQIDAADIKSPPQNIDNMLQSRSPGVQVMQGAAMAGSGAQIRLRGAVSVSQTNQPLIYVDGIRVANTGYLKNVPPVGYSGRSGNISESPINDINPNDIERIEVIKGAAASTLFGTDASAGVIQIFTKKGSQGAPRWSLQVDQGFVRTMPFGTDTNPFLNMKPCDPAQAPTTCSSIWADDSVAGKCYDEEVAASTTQCEWVRDGWRQKYAGSVSGGVGTFGYFASASYSNDDGVLPNDNQKRAVFRGNFNFDLLNDVRIDWNTQYSNNRILNTAAGNNAHGMTLNIYRAERNYQQSLEPELIAPLLNQEIKTEIDRFVTGATITHSPSASFTHRYTLGYDLAGQENRNLRPFGFVRAPGGILSDSRAKFQTITSDYTGNINFGVSSGLANSFSFGFNYVNRSQFLTTAYGDDFPGPGDPTVSNAANFISREERIRVITAGFFVQDVVNISDKYFITGGLRFDGNSAFGENLGLEMYPKLQASWVTSDEGFFPDALGQLKVRAALGWAGRAPGAFDAVRTWNPTAVDFTPGFTPDNVGNPNLGPERTREIEVGLDWGFLNNRISTEFTYYDQNTTDALFAVRQVPSLGFTNSQLQNVGEIRNRGIEWGLQAIVVDGANFGFDLGGSIYTVNSLVLDLGAAEPFAAGGGWVEEGFPVMAARGTHIKDRDAASTPAWYGSDGSATTCDGTNDATCAVWRDSIFGPQQATKIFNLNATFRFPANILLSARGESQAGAWINDGASSNALGRSVRFPQCEQAYQILDGGGSQDELTNRQRIECVSSNHIGSIHYYKQDFFKLRDVTLTVPLDFVTRSVGSSTLILTAQNFGRWINDDLRMFDPEMMTNGPSRNQGGVDNQNRGITEHIPAPAVFTASIRFSF